MQYIEVLFGFDFQEEYQRDLFVQGLADLGFESFTDDAAYIPANLFDEQALRAYASENSQTIRSISEVPDQNWNATWEAEHPIQELPLGVRITPHCAFGAGYHERCAGQREDRTGSGRDTCGPGPYRFLLQRTV